MTTETIKTPVLVLGSPVTITKIYHRRQHSQSDGRYTYTRKVWEPWAIKPRAALFLGWRTLINGRREWEPEVGAVFVPDKDGYIKAALVCFSTTENPVYVPAECLHGE